MKTLRDWSLIMGMGRASKREGGGEGGVGGLSEVLPLRKGVCVGGGGGQGSLYHA